MRVCKLCNATEDAIKAGNLTCVVRSGHRLACPHGAEVGCLLCISDVLSGPMPTDAPLSRLRQLRRMQVEISENPDRRGAILLREGFTEKDWSQAILDAVTDTVRALGEQHVVVKGQNPEADKYSSQIGPHCSYCGMSAQEIAESEAKNVFDCPASGAGHRMDDHSLDADILHERAIADAIDAGNELIARQGRLQWFLDEGYSEGPRKYTEQEVREARKAYDDGESSLDEEDLPTIHMWNDQAKIVPRDLRVQVSLYTIDRRPGGPEEGGWWYDWWEFAGISERVYPEDIDAARDRLLEYARPLQPTRNRYSVIGGPDYGTKVEDVCGEKAGYNEQMRVPHYC